MARRLYLLLVVILVGSLLAGGCAPGSGQAPPDPEVSLMPVPVPPESKLFSIAWLDDGLVVHVGSQHEATVRAWRLWRVRPDGSAGEPFTVPMRPGCQRQSVEHLTRLPDGRLGYIVRCFPNAESITYQLYMMAYDPRTGAAEQLLSYPLPSATVGKGGYAWDPAMRRGITNDGVGLREQLYWFTRAGWEPLDMGLSEAYGTSWSPDGRQIAFLGARHQGLAGIARADAVFELFVMQADGTGLRPLVTNIQYGAATAWSPDGRWLVFTGRVRSLLSGTWGLWLVDVSSGRLRLIAPGRFAFPAWSPDGRRLAVAERIGPPPNEYDEHRLVMIDVSELVQR